MRLRVRTSIGGSSRSFIEGQLIDVPAHTPAEIEAWFTEEPEFRVWLAQGVMEIVLPDAPEVADLSPLGETATLPRGRPFRRRGRGVRSSVWPPDQA